MSRRSILLLVGIFLAAILLACVGDVVHFQLASNLLAGWALFLVRVTPAMTIDWPSTFTALACLISLAVGLHLFLRWLCDQVQGARQPGEPASRPWKSQWTGMLLAIVVLIFVAGISTVGIAHQTTWMLSSPVPLTTSQDSMMRAARMQARLNLQQIGLALCSHSDARKALPPGGTFDANGRGLHGWQTALLPYIEQDRLYQEIDFNVPWSDTKNTTVFGTVVPAFVHPLHDPIHDGSGYAVSHFAANIHALGGDTPRRMPRDFPDGLSNTIFAGEAFANYKPWGHPANWRDPARGLCTTPEGFGDPVKGNRALFLMGDGTVITLTSAISPVVLKALSTPAGGESADDHVWDR